jgi:TatA/E family protein of Tat protein translocase
MGELFTPTHLAIVAVVAIVFFGGKKLPGLAKGLGEGASWVQGRHERIHGCGSSEGGALNACYS